MTGEQERSKRENQKGLSPVPDGAQSQTIDQLFADCILINHWNDEFNGAAGTGVKKANWIYDTGTGYGCAGCLFNWGTGEVETMTRSRANVYQDDADHLNIKPIRNAKGNWTSGRIETQRTDFAAPPGGKLAVVASIQQPNVSGNAALGYWPALGSAFRGNHLNWPRIGEIDIHCLWNIHARRLRAGLHIESVVTVRLPLAMLMAAVFVL